MLKVEHDTLPRHDTGVFPRQEGSLSSVHCCTHLRLRGTGHTRDHLLCCLWWEEGRHSIVQYTIVYYTTHRVIVVDPFVCLTLHKLAINEELRCGLWGCDGGVRGAVVCVCVCVCDVVHVENT